MTRVIYRLYYVLLIGLTACLTLSEVLLTGEMTRGKLLLVILTALLLSVLTILPKAVRWAVPAALILSVVLFSLTSAGGRSFLSDHFRYCFIHTGVSDAFAPENGTILFLHQILQCTLIVVAAFLLLLLFEAVPVVKYGAAGLVLIAGIVCLFREAAISHAGVITGILFVLSAGVEFLKKHGQKSQSADMAKYMVRLLPFFALLGLLLLVSPFSEDPYPWSYTRAFFQKIGRDLQVLQLNWGKGNAEDYGANSAGFSDSSVFFSGVNGSDHIYMTVTGSRMLITNLYLTGRYYDTFEGNGWLQTYEETSKDRLIDTMETMYSLRSYDFENQRNYMYTANASVTYGDFHTGYTFLPLKSYEMTEKRRNRNFFDDENFLSGQKRGYGDSYTFAFYQLNVDHEIFYRMLEESLPTDEEEWANTRRIYRVNAFSPEERAEYDARIYDLYTADYDLSPEVLSWIDEATKGAETGIQRLKMIELALSGYTYTKEPGPMPADIQTADDFLRYFLLEKREGYCTYYATAFVLLARAEGYPARFAEGFCVPMSDITVDVTGNMAHAWPEVYIEGNGFIPFEPTPGFDIYRYTPWSVDTPDNDMSNVRYWDAQNDTETPQMQQLPEDTMPDDSLSDDSLSNLSDESNKQSRPRKELARDITVLAAILIASLAVILAIVKIVSVRRYRRMSTSEKFVYESVRIFRMLSLLGLRLLPGETLEEFQNRIEMRTASWKNRPERLLFMAYYELYKYGNKEVTEDMLLTAVGEETFYRQNLLPALFDKSTRE